MDICHAWILSRTYYLFWASNHEVDSVSTFICDGTIEVEAVAEEARSYGTAASDAGAATSKAAKEKEATTKVAKAEKQRKATEDNEKRRGDRITALCTEYGVQEELVGTQIAPKMQSYCVNKGHSISVRAEADSESAITGVILREGTTFEVCEHRVALGGTQTFLRLAKGGWGFLHHPSFSDEYVCELVVTSTPANEQALSWFSMEAKKYYEAMRKLPVAAKVNSWDRQEPELYIPDPRFLVRY
jgi:hypothetical protein